jgi:DNA-directed RNA polymerase subunit alpha
LDNKPTTSLDTQTKGPQVLSISRPQVAAETDESNDRQKFRIAPLEPGFGHTIGNSLRRTLLSSVPGAAITQVRFDETLHEFDTIPGIKQDATDIILNLKDVVLRIDGDEAVQLRIEVSGPGVAKAGDIQCPAGVEIVNPEMVICDLTDKGKLAADLTAIKGRGYVSADKNKVSTTIGVIPIDSIFTPIRRVAFNIVPVQVEQSTDYDALILDIETDGSITPSEALASAGATLQALMGLVADMSENPQGLALGEVTSALAGSPDMELPIEDLDLSERPRNCLKRAQVNTIGELLTRTADDLMAITNFGQKSLDEVVVKLDERGLTLRGGGRPTAAAIAAAGAVDEDEI